MQYPHLEWLVNGQIVFVRFPREASVENIRLAYDLSAQYVDASTHSQVHFLHDWTQVEVYPRKLSEVRRAMRARVQDHHKIGWVVMYSHHGALLRMMADIAFQFFRIRFRMFPTRQDALDFLRRVDPTLNHVDWDTLV